MTHGQHAGEAGLPSAPTVRRTVVVILLPLILATVVGMVLLWPDGDRPQIEGAQRADATILDIQECEGTESGEACLDATVRIDSGPDQGVDVVIPVPFGEGAPVFEPGDAVVIAAADDQPIESRYELIDRQRAWPLFALAVTFALAVIALSRWRGRRGTRQLGVVSRDLDRVRAAGAARRPAAAGGGRGRWRRPS